MGLLDNGEWKHIESDTDINGGAFKRREAVFRKLIEPNSVFTPESNLYHLYISHACPWANRTTIFLHLKSLKQHISVSVVHPHMLENGWSFKSNFPGTTADTVYGLQYLHEIYTMAEPKYSGHVTVPVLWDKAAKTIFSNESSDIMRMFNSAFNVLTDDTTDYYPRQLRSEIYSLNNRIYSTVNNGAYKRHLTK